MNTQIVIAGIAIAIIMLIQFVILAGWQNEKKEDLILAFQKGYDNGVKDTVVALYGQTENCHMSTITTGNLTKDLIDIRCLQSFSEKPNP
jgi:hypothetical protein